MAASGGCRRQPELDDETKREDTNTATSLLIKQPTTQLAVRFMSPANTNSRPPRSSCGTTNKTDDKKTKTITASPQVRQLN